MSDLKSKENCFGAYPALFRFTFSHEVPMRAFSESTGEYENIGGMRTLEGQYDVVALSPGLAIEAFKLQYPASVYALRTGPDFVCYVDAMVGVSKNYGMNFA